MSSATFYASTVRLKSCFTNLLLPSILVKSNSKKIARDLSRHQPQKVTEANIKLIYQVKPKLKKVNLQFRKGAYFATGPDDLGKLKALLRTITFIEIPKSKFTLLHSALLRLSKEFFAIVGSSGSGKTTYAKLLQQKLGAKILANDYLLCKKEENVLLVSDLNFATELKHKSPVHLTTLFICTPREGIDKNNVWQPRKKEFIKLVTESLTYLPSDKTYAVVGNFWNRINQDKIRIICINTRKRSIGRTCRDFERIIREIIAKEKPFIQRRFNLAVVGLGAVGSQIVAQLLNKDYINQIYIHNRILEKQHGLALDFSQTSQLLNPDSQKIVECDDFGKCLLADFLVICVREAKKSRVKIKIPKKNLTERMRRILPHLKIFRNFAAELRKRNYKGKILVVTNPVEILAWFLYFFSNLNKHGKFDGEGLSQDQIYGIGLELDKARAELVAKEILGPGIDTKIEPYIQHGDDLALRITITTGKLTKAQGSRILQKTLAASADIRKFIPRTVYGPSAAVIRSLEGIIGINQKPTHLSVIYKDFTLGMPVEFWAQIPRFGLPKERSLIVQISKWREKFIKFKKLFVGY